MIKTDMKAPVQLAPYVVVKNEADHRLSVHSDACDRQQAPYVYVLKRGKTARVVMDLIFVKDADRFNQDEVFIEKMLDACEQAAGDAAYGTFLPGLYTMLNRVPVENAETLAQAFYAISQQALGKTEIALPVFEHPVSSDVRSRLLEAIDRGYALARGVADWLPTRYDLWCRAHGRACICVVWQRRTGYAELVAKWPSGFIADFPVFRSHLERIAEEFEVCHSSMTSQQVASNRAILWVDETGARVTHHLLRLEVAEELARVIVRLSAHEGGSYE